MMTNMDFSRCATCLEDYDDSSHRPCIGFCGHSLCLKCQTRIVSCPLCKRKNAFFGTVINYQLLDACVAIRQMVNERNAEANAEKKSPSRSRSSSKRHVETPNISQQVVNATRRSRRTALETAVDKTQQREIENSWVSQHIPAPESRRRERSNRRLSERLVFTEHLPPPCHYRTIYALPQDVNMKFLIALVVLVVLMVVTKAHFPVYSLYKERRPMDLFRALSLARQQKRRIGGFDEVYRVPEYD